jgi:hypothetical protein
MKESFMTRRANALAALAAAALVIGCSPDSSAPSPEEPDKADVILRHSPAKEGGGATTKKPNKEPGPRKIGTTRSGLLDPSR